MASVADVAVVTDSTGYLPAALLNSLEITVVPLYYDVGSGLVRETDFDGDLSKFYAELDVAKTVAPTSPPTVEDFLRVFERLLMQHSAVVSVLLSSAISETCTNARQAVSRLESAGERVVVIDSAGTLGHLGVQAVAAARAAIAGEDRSGVIARTRRARQEVRVWGLLDTLEYLRRGGRVGTAAAWLGSALDIKPIITIESETKAVERVRTRSRGVDRLVELMLQSRAAMGADRWFVQHTCAHEDAQRLADRLDELFGTEPEFVSELGPVGATQLGPRTLWAGGVSVAALDGDLG
jgi:DegV family protein with EDD domain